MNKMALVLAAILAAVAFSVMAQALAGKIVKQERHGRVVTNSLFLAMSPDVKKEIARINGEKLVIDTIKAVAEDTRSHIPEAAGLSDIEIAGLYLKQVKKSSNELEAIAQTNTLEHLIGAGMRQDLNKKD